MSNSMDNTSEQISLNMLDEEEGEFDDLLEIEEENEYTSFVDLRQNNTIFEDINNILNISQNSPNKSHNYKNTHKTTNYLTKYEITKIIGLRAQQLSVGAIPFVNIDTNIKDTIQIACMELHDRKIPYIIRRPLSNDKYEYWKIKDLGLRPGFLYNM